MSISSKGFIESWADEVQQSEMGAIESYTAATAGMMSGIEEAKNKMRRSIEMKEKKSALLDADMFKSNAYQVGEFLIGIKEFKYGKNTIDKIMNGVEEKVWTKHLQEDPILAEDIIEMKMRTKDSKPIEGKVQESGKTCTVHSYSIGVHVTAIFRVALTIVHSILKYEELMNMSQICKLLESENRNNLIELAFEILCEIQAICLHAHRNGGRRILGCITAEAAYMGLGEGKVRNAACAKLMILGCVLRESISVADSLVMGQTNTKNVEQIMSSTVGLLSQMKLNKLSVKVYKGTDEQSLYLQKYKEEYCKKLSELQQGLVTTAMLVESNMGENISRIYRLMSSIKISDIIDMKLSQINNHYPFKSKNYSVRQILISADCYVKTMNEQGQKWNMTCFHDEAIVYKEKEPVKSKMFEKKKQMKSMRDEYDENISAEVTIEQTSEIVKKALSEIKDEQVKREKERENKNIEMIQENEKKEKERLNIEQSKTKQLESVQPSAAETKRQTKNLGEIKEEEIFDQNLRMEIMDDCKSSIEIQWNVKMCRSRWVARRRRKNLPKNVVKRMFNRENGLKREEKIKWYRLSGIDWSNSVTNYFLQEYFEKISFFNEEKTKLWDMNWTKKLALIGDDPILIGDKGYLDEVNENIKNKFEICDSVLNYDFSHILLSCIGYNCIKSALDEEVIEEFGAILVRIFIIVLNGEEKWSKNVNNDMKVPHISIKNEVTNDICIRGAANGILTQIFKNAIDDEEMMFEEKQAQMTEGMNELMMKFDLYDAEEECEEKYQMVIEDIITSGLVNINANKMKEMFNCIDDVISCYDGINCKGIFEGRRLLKNINEILTKTRNFENNTLLWELPDMEIILSKMKDCIIVAAIICDNCNVTYKE